MKPCSGSTRGQKPPPNIFVKKFGITEVRKSELEHPKAEYMDFNEDLGWFGPKDLMGSIFWINRWFMVCVLDVK